RAIPGRAVPSHCGPPLMVDAAIAEHLEILGLASFGGLGVVEGIQHADTFQRSLLHAVNDRGCRQPGGFQNRRRYVDDVMKLRADLALSLDPVWPVHNRAVAR